MPDDGSPKKLMIGTLATVPLGRDFTAHVMDPAAFAAGGPALLYESRVLPRDLAIMDAVSWVRRNGHEPCFARFVDGAMASLDN